ncbi:class D sortase [Bacillus sp. 03113]|uniref:class D sortase n=1 Tax=Bacillus sp. 03113 TaxID=2578211 RepID=UPI001144ACCF|nr:class D sortase [Bacillus sp. 03113]
MQKFIGIFILLTGIGFIAASGYELWNYYTGQKQALKEADTIPKEKKMTISDFKPRKGEVIGKLLIPIIDAKLPIIEGTEEDDLEKGVGHYRTTGFPGGNDQILLSGHRDTVFKRFNEIKIGDHLTVELPYGKFEYEIKETKIVSADDTTVIRSTVPNEVLTISTCYPFRYIGNAPDRFIVYAYPVEQISKR